LTSLSSTTSAKVLSLALSFGLAQIARKGYLDQMITSRRRSRLPDSIQCALLLLFVAGTPARAAAGVVGVNRYTATLFFHKLRKLIAVRLAAEAPELLSGEIEIDESYFDGRRKGKRGRGAGGKVRCSAC
jgi:transposase